MRRHSAFLTACHDLEPKDSNEAEEDMSYDILTLRKVCLVEVEIYSSWSMSSILGVYVSFLFILLHLLV